MMNGPDLSTCVPTQHMQISVDHNTTDNLHLGICYKVKDIFVLTKTKQVNFHNFSKQRGSTCPCKARQGVSSVIGTFLYICFQVNINRDMFRSVITFFK